MSHVLDTSHLPGFDLWWRDTGSRLVQNSADRDHVRGVCALAWEMSALESRVREETATAILQGYSAAIQAVKEGR
jgi:hypothetical protein